MFTLKRQAKSIKTLHLFFGLLIIFCFCVLVVPTSQTSSQTATPSARNESSTLHTIPILPTEAPDTPVLLPLESIQNLNPTPTPFDDASASPSGDVNTDFCLKVPVLVYHHVQPMPIASQLGHKVLTIDSSIFEQQVKYIKENGYNAISAEDLVNAIYAYQPLPEKSILITIDDGYDDNYTYAFLYAKKYEIVMNFMIPTQLIGKPGYMTWDHLREMQTSQFAKIYNHTATHAPLGYILKSQIDNELLTSKRDFQKELGVDINIFTYPYGSYNPQSIETLKTHGFKAAFTTDEGQDQCMSNIMQLKRTRIGNAPLSSYGF